MRKFKSFILYLLLFVVLTTTTQIGGGILLLSIWVGKRWSIKFKGKYTLVFTGIYLIATFVVVPLLAPLGGRERVAVSKTLKPANYFSVVLNRNYVRPNLNKVLQQVSDKRHVRFLDANFPFMDKFPLLPHLSHNDGNKIDLSFIYENENGEIVHQNKSISGYGVFEGPQKGEFNQIEVCKNQGYFQYDYPKYLTLGKTNPELRFSVSENKRLITKLVNNPQIEKLFIEPHLVTRMDLHHSKIRYHGCRAVRHDDHIHIQVKDE